MSYNILLHSVKAILLLFLFACGKSVIHESDNSMMQAAMDAEGQKDQDAKPAPKAKVETTPEKPVVAEAPKMPVVEEVPKIPAVEEVPQMPVVEDIPEEPMEAPENNLPTINQLTVGGYGLDSMKSVYGSLQTVVWESQNADECIIKYGDSVISTSLSGSKKIKTDDTENVSIECGSNDEKASKEILVEVKKEGDDGNMIGIIQDEISGYYDNPKWGEMVIRVDGNDFLATYNYYKGTVKGSYNQDTGKVTAYWCEVWDGKRGGDEAEGQAQFIFIKDKSTGKIRLDGKWRYGSDSKWKNDWDLDLIKSPSSTQQKIKGTLDKTFSQSGVFCDS